MAARAKLDPEVFEILCCAVCKGTLSRTSVSLVCNDCETEYPRVESTLDESGNIYDLRIRRPAYALRPSMRVWVSKQKRYERYETKVESLNDFSTYLNEIDSVREIYSEEFRIFGRVLDVGGHQGRLRHHLRKSDVDLYISADPFLEVFRSLDNQPNLLRAYPCLSQPCNFVPCHAENLPFIVRVFDWVHMRSVLDHLDDPYLALKEAFRVLKDDGFLLIGLKVSLGSRSGRAYIRSIVERAKRKLRSEGSLSLLWSAAQRANLLADHHTFRWSCNELIELVRNAGFSITKAHWQKEPFVDCVYLCARKA